MPLVCLFVALLYPPKSYTALWKKVLDADSTPKLDVGIKENKCKKSSNCYNFGLAINISPRLLFFDAHFNLWQIKSDRRYRNLSFVKRRLALHFYACLVAETPSCLKQGSFNCQDYGCEIEAPWTPRPQHTHTHSQEIHNKKMLSNNHKVNIHKFLEHYLDPWEERGKHDKLESVSNEGSMQTVLPLLKIHWLPSQDLWMLTKFLNPCQDLDQHYLP